MIWAFLEEKSLNMFECFCVLSPNITSRRPLSFIYWSLSTLLLLSTLLFSSLTFEPPNPLFIQSHVANYFMCHLFLVSVAFLLARVVRKSERTPRILMSLPLSPQTGYCMYHPHLLLRHSMVMFKV